MNTYVYAPKDDPLHRNNWRGLYTEDQIENEIKPQAEAGNKSKVRFVYALAPFHNDGEARGQALPLRHRGALPEGPQGTQGQVHADH